MLLLHKVLRFGERLPWDHFEVGVKKANLVREWERAVAPEPVGAP